MPRPETNGETPQGAPNHGALPPDCELMRLRDAMRHFTRQAERPRAELGHWHAERDRVAEELKIRIMRLRFPRQLRAHNPPGEVDAIDALEARLEEAERMVARCEGPAATAERQIEAAGRAYSDATRRYELLLADRARALEDLARGEQLDRNGGFSWREGAHLPAAQKNLAAIERELAELTSPRVLERWPPLPPPERFR
jgi:hypothetical protein